MSPEKWRYFLYSYLTKTHLKVSQICTHSNIDSQLVILICPPPLAIHGYQLSPQEHALSVTSCPLGTIDPQRVYYVVGTAFVNQTEKEPSQGRVLVLEVTEGQLCVCVCVCVCVCACVRARACVHVYVFA